MKHRCNETSDVYRPWGKQLLQLAGSILGATPRIQAIGIHGRDGYHYSCRIARSINSQLNSYDDFSVDLATSHCYHHVIRGVGMLASYVFLGNTFPSSTNLAAEHAQGKFEYAWLSEDHFG